jgi:hypothetical protein
MTFVAGECTQEGDLAMPIIETNEKLTRIIRGRSIELVIQEAGLVTIVFDDYSTMRVHKLPEAQPLVPDCHTAVSSVPSTRPYFPWDSLGNFHRGSNLQQGAESKL